MFISFYSENVHIMSRARLFFFISTGIYCFILFNVHFIRMSYISVTCKCN